jgi:hypothetical protein
MEALVAGRDGPKVPKSEVASSTLLCRVCVKLNNRRGWIGRRSYILNTSLWRQNARNWREGGRRGVQPPEAEISEVAQAGTASPRPRPRARRSPRPRRRRPRLSVRRRPRPRPSPRPRPRPRRRRPRASIRRRSRPRPSPSPRPRPRPRRRRRRLRTSIRRRPRPGMSPPSTRSWTSSLRSCSKVSIRRRPVMSSRSRPRLTTLRLGPLLFSTRASTRQGTHNSETSLNYVFIGLSTKHLSFASVYPLAVRLVCAALLCSVRNGHGLGSQRKQSRLPVMCLLV